MNKPKKCCQPGEFICQIPMPINGKVQCIDFCISHIVSALNAGDVRTIASCCGHGKYNGSIILENNTELIIRKFGEKIELTAYSKA